ncbi:MAG TPA: hypothetical protein VJC39_00895 [Candidatus Nanoarchaeia archaeon]|nr:hypothetical protein [Candidatus Nanoarchaeia archaeon]
MASEEYEILPHKLLEDLKYDVEALKKKLNEPDQKINELILEIEELKDSMHELTVVFKKALESLKSDDPTRLLQDVINQNKVIAKGMITISDKLEDFMSKNESMKPVMGVYNPPPIKHNLGMPQPPPMERMAPYPTMPGIAPRLDIPPPPPWMGDKKRMGLFK